MGSLKIVRCTTLEESIYGRLRHTSTQSTNMHKQRSLWVSVCESGSHGLTLVARVEADCVHSALPHLQPLWGALVLGQLQLQQPRWAPSQEIVHPDTAWGRRISARQPHTESGSALQTPCNLQTANSFILCMGKACQYRLPLLQCCNVCFDCMSGQRNNPLTYIAVSGNSQ